ncbi:MAG: KamA family radical SAM protein [Candidatus Latescibacteria bacterium]|nr:KamA family radical SAM protein [Candidatus Latescibacterota bacterium]MBT5830906.1 KamA family radical SAM protein [Candidatus Latescibacterota bacterium]
MGLVEPECTESSQHLKPPVEASALEHRVLRRDEYWRTVPAYKDVDAETFHSHLFQMRNSVTSVGKLMQVLGDTVSPEFYRDVTLGIEQAPMSIRISPYLLSLINWDDPYSDPIRRQFLAVGSHQQPNHPELHLDSLNEQGDSPVPGLTHRYPDRVLFLVLDTCPVYCRFCTRSYAVGLDTGDVEKVQLRVNRERWDGAINYIASRPEVEDVVVSGGDMYQLKADQLQELGDRILDIDHIRRFRFATKGPAVLPQKLVTDHAWVDALTRVVDRGRKLNKEVVLHTHFNHPNELTGITEDGIQGLKQRGIIVRNQSVLQRGVNDDVDTMQMLIKRLSYLNVQPYYVFFHDLVSGVEDLRTTLAAGLDIEKQVRGVTAGYNTPTFIVDTLGGGGKRDAHSYEHYNPETGVAVYTSPVVRPGAHLFYFDPIDSLSDGMQVRWQDGVEREKMKQEALESARSC